MQRVKEKAIELLQSGAVDRVLGWRTGEFFYDLTPGCFSSAEEVEKEFIYSVFSGANLSKYLIAESRRGGKVGVFLKPCDSYSFVQLLKEHRILREHVYAVGVQCGGMCDMEKIKEAGLAGVTAVEEDGETLRVSISSICCSVTRKPIRFSTCGKNRSLAERTVLSLLESCMPACQRVKRA